jgi:DNA repair protein RadA/Sms
MPPKAKKIYVCTQCGYESGKWVGKCPDCGQWNSMAEELRQPESFSAGLNPLSETSASVSARNLAQLESGDEIRLLTGIGELDRVLGAVSFPVQSHWSAGIPELENPPCCYRCVTPWDNK